MTTITLARVGALTLAMTIGSATMATAQQDPPGSGASLDSRWAPWLGCWQLLDESVQDPALLAEALGALGRTRERAGAIVCVTPGDDKGVTMTTLVNDRPVLTETIVADGSNRRLEEPECRGWHRAEWSQLGARLFAQAELACASQAPRTVSGLSLMMAGPLWIDVQLIESEGRKSLRVRRYQRSVNQKYASKLPWPDQKVRAVPLNSRLTVADVKEASGKIAPETLQAALVELNKGFDLGSKELIELDRAGVPDNVIDLMVALTYPKRFVVEKNTSGSGSWGVGGFDSMWPYYTDPFFYTSYYAPFGYRYWGYYDPYYFQGPGFVVVNPQQEGIQPSGTGRVVDGRGYTRIRRNEPESSGRPGSDGAWSTSAADRSGGSGSSSGGGVSSSGYSSGGGSGGDRTAQPRPPGQ